MDGIVSGLPQVEKIRPQYGERSKGPASAGMVQVASLLLPYVEVLANAPLGCHMSVKHMAPSNFGLFANQLVVSPGITGR